MPHYLRHPTHFSTPAGPTNCLDVPASTPRAESTLHPVSSGKASAAASPPRPAAKASAQPAPTLQITGYFSGIKFEDVTPSASEANIEV